MAAPTLNFAQKIALELLWLFASLFARLPRWFKFYIVQETLYFLLHYCLRYRVRVVDANLRTSFPEKSERERRAIRRGFYRTLAELFVDTVNLAHMTDRKLNQLVYVVDRQEMIRQTHRRDWIALSSHFGCWEYNSFWGMIDPSHELVGVYHPLQSVVMEQFYRRLRKFDKATMVAMQDTVRFYLRHSAQGVDGKRLVLGLIADQNPPRRPDSRWFNFLGQDTIFFDGAEKLALRFGLPVYFHHTERIRRGCYRMSFELIYDGVEQVAENEITERYVRRLEAQIREHPELWLWSHRRWKHKR